jgi:hypothetical protein
MISQPPTNRSFVHNNASAPLNSMRSPLVTKTCGDGESNRAEFKKQEPLVSAIFPCRTPNYEISRMNGFDD